MRIKSRTTTLAKHDTQTKSRYISAANRSVQSILHMDTHGGLITVSGARILVGNEGNVLIMSDVTQDLHK